MWVWSSISIGKRFTMIYLLIFIVRSRITLILLTILIISVHGLIIEDSVSGSKTLRLGYQKNIGPPIDLFGIWGVRYITLVSLIAVIVVLITSSVITESIFFVSIVWKFFSIMRWFLILFIMIPIFKTNTY